MNSLEANEAHSNTNLDALDDDEPPGFDNEWADNDFGTSSGF